MLDAVSLATPALLTLLHLFKVTKQIKAAMCRLNCRPRLSAVPRAGPRNMRVFDPTTSSLIISWDHAEGPVRQYKISYSPMDRNPSSRAETVSRSLKRMEAAHTLLHG